LACNLLTIIYGNLDTYPGAGIISVDLARAQFVGIGVALSFLLHSADWENTVQIEAQEVGRASETCS